MTPVRFMFAILSLLFLVWAVPAWVHFAGERVSGLPPEVQLLAGISLPAAILIFLASQAAPGGA